MCTGARYLEKLKSIGGSEKAEDKAEICSHTDILRSWGHLARWSGVQAMSTELTSTNGVTASRGKTAYAKDVKHLFS